MSYFSLALTIVSGTFLWGQPVRPPQTPLTREEIRQTLAEELRQQGVREEQLPRLDDIELPAALSADAERTLRVSSVRWMSDRGRAQFRIECSAGHCIPFLVDVRMERSVLKSLAISKTPSSRPRPTAAVRNGDHATVVFLGDRLHLTAAVTCLEHGAAGDVIRVRNEDGHIFRARISGPGLLEALPQK